MEHGNSNHLNWSAEVWQQINKVVHDEAAAVRRARRDEGSTLPETHSGRVFSLFGPQTNNEGSVTGHKVVLTKEGRLSIPAGQDLVPVKIWVEFELDQPQFKNANVAMALATKAAYHIALAEEYVTLLGANATLFLDRMNVSYEYINEQAGLFGKGNYQVDKPILDSINDGIKELRDRNHHGEYCAIVSPELFREAYAPRNNTLDAPIYEIRPLLRKTGFLYSPALTGKTGVIFSLGGGTLDMAVPVDIRVESDPEKQGKAILRVEERFCLRVNDDSAVISLGQREAAVTREAAAKPVRTTGKGA